MSVIIVGPKKNVVKNVVAYARVSTLQEEQEESFENQKAYYESYIKSVPSWNFGGIYADQGLSGRDTKHRLAFKQMISDAMQGKIDIILVKSISRFSRNAIDAQKYVQLLRQHSVEVRFDKEQLSSFDRNTELALNTLVICAEQESKSLSDNVRWTFQKLARKGIRHLGNNKVLGYDEIKGVLIPNERANIVRLIFENYAAGLSYQAIANKLENCNTKTMKGKDHFSTTTICRILHNEIYVGDRLIQKQPPKNFYTKKPDYTIEYESFYIKNDHEPIISRELWDKVQYILKVRNKHKRVKQATL